MTTSATHQLTDAQGRPLTVFHGTSTQFDAFAPNVRGIFFSEDIAKAELYSRIRRGTPRIIAAHLTVRNPWRVIRYGEDVPYSRMIDQSPNALRARGYDAMHDPEGKVWIVFDVNQISIQDHDYCGPRLALEPASALGVHDQTPGPMPGRGAKLAAWFGQSQVVNADGSPRVVYHGTASDFATFQRTGSGEFGPAIYTTDSAREAAEYGAGQRAASPSIMPLYVRLERPFLDGVEAFWQHFGSSDGDAAAVQRAVAAGFDGIIAQRADTYYDNATGAFVDRGDKLTHYVVFDPCQLKSALGNSGTFDLHNDDIRFSLAPQEDDFDSAKAPAP